MLSRVGQTNVTLGPFIRGKISRVSRELSHLYGHSLSKELVRGLGKPRTSFSCRLYEQFAAYISRGLCTPRLISPRINGPIVQHGGQTHATRWVQQCCTNMLHPFGQGFRPDPGGPYSRRWTGDSLYMWMWNYVATAGISRVARTKDQCARGRVWGLEVRQEVRGGVLVCFATKPDYASPELV